MTKAELVKALERYQDNDPVMIQDPDTGWDILVVRVEGSYPRLVTAGYQEDMSLNGQLSYEDRMYR